MMIAGFGLLFWLIFIVVGVLITVAPLVIWRNTNRQNRLLALMARNQGIPAVDICNAWDGEGGYLPVQIRKEAPSKYLGRVDAPSEAPKE